MANSTAVPTLLTDPGFLFYAPVGTAEPANTVLASKFSDPWPVAWVNLGATMDGSEFSYATTVSPITVSEFLDPIRQVPTGRMGKVSFALASYTATNLKFALNGGITTVTGTTATTLTKVNPPIPGQEVRTMIGWESLDASVRMVAYQTFNNGDLKVQSKKAPNYGTIQCEFDMEIPIGGQPFSIYTAGVARA